MDTNGILYLSNGDVKKVLDLGRAIEITEQALRDHSEGRVTWSTPEDLAIKPEQGWQLWVTGNPAGSRISHPLDQGRRRQPGPIAPTAWSKANPNPQRPGGRRDPRHYGRGLVPRGAHRSSGDCSDARARA